MSSSDGIQLPESYSKLPFTQIRAFHVPESSPEPTPVILLKLWRPDRGNAFTDKMKDELIQAYAMFDVDPRVKCIVLTGEGKMFCAGADLQIGFPGQGSGPGARTKVDKENTHRDGGGQASLAIHRCSKPTVVAQQGAAVGVGMTMALPAAIRIAYGKAKCGFVFARRGIIMEAASHWFLPKLIGLGKAMHLTTTGGVYPAEHPLMKDLYSELLPSPEATVKRGLELADEIAKNTSTVSTKLMRDLMIYTPDTPEEAHLLDSRVIYGCFGSPDNKEGVASFFEKRGPNFPGQFPEDAPQAYPWWTPVDIKKDKAPSKLSKL